MSFRFRGKTRHRERLSLVSESSYRGQLPLLHAGAVYVAGTTARITERTGWNCVACWVQVLPQLVACRWRNRPQACE